MSTQIDDFGDNLYLAGSEEQRRQRAQELTGHPPAPPTAPLTSPTAPPARRTAGPVARVVLALGVLAAVVGTAAVLKAQRDAIEQTQAGLEDRLETVEYQLARGVRAPADRRQYQARLEALEAELRRLARAHAELQEQLRQARGRADAAAPAGPTPAPHSPVPQVSERDREELRRLDALLEKQRK